MKLEYNYKLNKQQIKYLIHLLGGKSNIESLIAILTYFIIKPLYILYLINYIYPYTFFVIFIL